MNSQNIVFLVTLKIIMHLGDRPTHAWKFLKSRRWGTQRIFLTSLGVTGCIVAVRLAGLLQSWELAAYDQLIRSRPANQPDHRIVIVGIDEPDLRQVGQFPIPDGQMAALINKLKQTKPRVIGLDIYRDLPVEPGHQALNQLFKTTPNLVGIEHIGDEDGPNIPPPAALSKFQVGFNNIVHDADDKVRRGLLYFFEDETQDARPSFALVLALRYLQKEGIEAKTARDQTGFLQLGEAIFRRFTPNDGSYVYADAGGYQILMNPRGPANSFHYVSMADVMQGKVPPEVFRDRIVLIGYTAISTNDFALMSYSSHLVGAPQPIPGVELHANIVSQIINAAQEQRPLITSWAEPLEWAWVCLWAWVGAIISWKLRSFKFSLLAIGASGAAIVAIGLYALIQGTWIPVIPPLIAIAGSAIVITAHIARSEEELRRSKEFLSTIINTIPDPIYVKDRTHRWIVLNEAFSHLLRQPREALLERSGYDVFSQQEAEAFHYYDELVFTTGEAHQNEELFTDTNGVAHYTETKRSLHRDAAGNLFLVGIIRDITERKRMEEELKRTAAELIRSNAELQKSASQLSHFAHHDSLTGLPNRKLFYDRLEQAIQWAADRDQLVGLLFLDLDGFKEINDSKGHDVGDWVLKTVAIRLSGCLRGSDTVSRLGGDEFTVILPAIPSAQDAARVAEKVLSTLTQPFVLENDTIVVTSSIGISLYPHHAQAVEMLLKEADNAMYQAKQHGKNRYQFAIQN
ncbi:MAG: CHASE2 domain-containing protein [Leptolyngbyaceae cyanobacterium bins.302]|nr:CHASE2 domain-containing protein [Leptolyngbyaceae cyanobacterium bins.302]